MSPGKHVRTSRARVGASFPVLFEQVRHRRRRRRNLAELKTLDGDRLQDIGLSEAVRKRIIGAT